MDPLLERVLAANGGLDRWRAVRTIDLVTDASSILFARFLVKPWWRAARVTVERDGAVLHEYPRPGRRAVFRADRVAIEDEGGAVLAERRDPRSFMARGRRHLWWDHLDAAYFIGYALWNYLWTPLLLTREDVAVAPCEPLRAGRETWEGLEVRFPPSVPTHSPVQRFYFDPDLLLRRHLYLAEVFGAWARARHVTSRHARVDGLVVPMRRRVHWRPGWGPGFGGPALPVSVISLDYRSVTVRA